MTDILRSTSWLRAERKSPKKYFFFVFYFDVWLGARTLALRLISPHYPLDYGDFKTIYVYEYTYLTKFVNINCHRKNWNCFKLRDILTHISTSEYLTLFFLNILEQHRDSLMPTNAHFLIFLLTLAAGT